MQPKIISLIFTLKNKSFLFATTLIIQQPKPMAYNTNASLKKRAWTDYVDFRKGHDIFGTFSWSKNDSNYLDVKFKVLKKDDNEDFLNTQKARMGEAGSNQFSSQRNQLVVRATDFTTEWNLSSVQIPTICKAVNEQPKLAHKAGDVVDRANTQICVILLRYCVDGPKSSYAEVR